jgi:serine/threonine-protein kinase
MDADANLLFGVLALQGDLIDRERFVEACTAWAAEKGRPLSELLVARGWITDEDRTHLEYLLHRKLERHAGDARRCLEASIGPEASEALASIDDPDVRGTITRAPPAAGHVLLSTVAYEPERRERYRLTRLHAKGGLGQVWLARDTELGRNVALKELRPDRSRNPNVWARFFDEARITGQLEHPGIVPVYELAKPEGDAAPFYTMRFVRGRTLAEATEAYHRRRRDGEATPLDLANLLNAFVGVCNAIAYAHSRGVIHRDLKGQNVVLGDFGEVIVLDWGLAKIVGQPAADRDAPPPLVPPASAEPHDATLPGQAIGTPAYMAPEQAEGRSEAIDAHTDIYGLGAILYEILAGQPPFSGDDTAEVLRRVVHEEPRRPRLLNPVAPAALESIGRKAMAKRPGDRYARADDLAQDVRRFLADEPVSVHRDPLSTRLTRWGRRHRTAAAATMALMATALVSVSVAAVLIGRERARAERSFREARRAVDDYFTTVSESTLLDAPGLQPLRKDLLERAKRYYEGFLRQRGDDPAVRAEAAASLYRLADITQQIGTSEEALASYTRALAAYEALTRDRPSVTQYRVDLAMICNNLAGVHSLLGRREEAFRLQEQALAIRERHAREHPEGGRFQNELGKSYSNLGGLYYARGEPDRAMEFFQRARRIGEQLVRQPGSSTALPTILGQRYNSPRTFKLDLAHDLYWISLLEYRRGRTDAAIRTIDETRELYEVLLRENPADIAARGSAATATEDCGYFRLIAGRNDEAEPYLRAAYRMIDELVRENPAVGGFRSKLAAIANDLGRWERERGRLDAAEALQRQALEVQEAVVRDHPGPNGYRWTLANIHRELGWIARQRDEPEEARRAFATARALDEALPPSYADRYCELARDWALERAMAGPGREDTAIDDAGRAARQRLEEQAMAALRRAVEGGFRNREHLEREPDLESLHSREDFRALVASIADQPPPTSAPRTAARPARVE